MNVRSATGLVVAMIWLGAASAILHPLGAQGCTGQAVPGARTTWPENDVHPPPNPVSAADRAAITATLTRIETLVRNTVYGTPRGYEVLPRWYYEAPASRNRVSSYSFLLGWWCPTVKATGGDGEVGINISVNPTPGEWSLGGDRPDANGDLLYELQHQSARQYGATLAFGDLTDRVDSRGLWLVYTTGDVSPTLPVTREEWLRAQIFEIERDMGPTKKTAYQEFLDGAADRKKARDETVAAVAASDPAKAEQLRKDLEKAERDNEELYKQNEKGASDIWRNGVERYKARIAAMTPQERAAPAYISGDNFVSPDDPDAHAVVRKNPALYRARTSPFEPRLIVVYLPHNYKELDAVNRQMYREFDWAALKRLVNP